MVLRKKEQKKAEEERWKQNFTDHAKANPQLHGKKRAENESSRLQPHNQLWLDFLFLDPFRQIVNDGFQNLQHGQQQGESNQIKATLVGH